MNQLQQILGAEAYVALLAKGQSVTMFDLPATGFTQEQLLVALGWVVQELQREQARHGSTISVMQALARHQQTHGITG